MTPPEIAAERFACLDDFVDAYYVIFYRQVGTKKSGPSPWKPMLTLGALHGDSWHPRYVAGIWNAKQNPRSRNCEEYAVFKIPTKCLERIDATAPYAKEGANG